MFKSFESAYNFALFVGCTLSLMYCGSIPIMILYAASMGYIAGEEFEDGLV